MLLPQLDREREAYGIKEVFLLVTYLICFLKFEVLKYA